MTISGHVVADLHCDLFEFSRRYRRDPRRRHRRLPWFVTEGHSDVPRLLAGGVDFVLCGVYAPFRRGDWAWRSARATLEFLSRTGPVLVDSPADVRPGRVQAAAALEGAHLLGGRPQRIAEAAAMGVRAVGLAHLGPNDCATRRGLTPLGRDVVTACREAGVLVDLAHCPEAAFWDAVEMGDGPLFVSHAGARRLHRHHRLLTDDQIRAVAARGGVVGVIFFPLYLKGRPWGTLDDVIDHIAAVIEVGGPASAALGSDWDGAVTMPRGLEDPTGLPKLAQRMEARGLAAELPGVLGANFMAMWSMH